VTAPRTIPVATRLRGYAALLHPFPVAMTVFAAALFAVVAARGRPDPLAMGWLVLSVLLSQVAIASLNDYHDRALDAATKPWKPLPAGLVPPTAALAIAGAATPLALLCAVPLGPPALLAAAVGTASGLIYDVWAKGTVWSFVPFVVAFPVLPIWAWSAVAPFEPRLLEAYLVGGPLVLGLHLADTWPDLESDKAHGVEGLAHHLGARRTRALMWVCFGATPLVLVALALLPGRTPGALLAAAGVGGALILAALTLSRGGTLPRASGAAAWGDTAGRGWQAAFALLATAAVVLGLGWLASMAFGSV
jgi:4-hydroxybenzoate polyprenyltransferase